MLPVDIIKDDLRKFFQRNSLSILALAYYSWKYINSTQKILRNEVDTEVFSKFKDFLLEYHVVENLDLCLTYDPLDGFETVLSIHHGELVSTQSILSTSSLDMIYIVLPNLDITNIFDYKLSIKDRRGKNIIETKVVDILENIDPNESRFTLRVGNQLSQMINHLSNCLNNTSRIINTICIFAKIYKNLNIDNTDFENDLQFLRSLVDKIDVEYIGSDVFEKYPHIDNYFMLRICLKNVSYIEEMFNSFEDMSIYFTTHSFDYLYEFFISCDIEKISNNMIEVSIAFDISFDKKLNQAEMVMFLENTLQKFNKIVKDVKHFITAIETLEQMI